MTRPERFRIVAASISMAIGIMFWALPEQWIERQLRVSLDGGSGLLEFLLVAIPIAGSVALVLGVVGRRKLQKRSNQQACDLAQRAGTRSA